MASKRKKKPLSQRDKKYIFGSVGVLVALFIPVIVISQLSNKEALDSETLCPAGGEQRRITLLIDKSDRWGDDDITRVNAMLVDEYSRIPAQSRLIIYGIVGDGRKSTEVKQYFDLCNPGTEKECNALYQDCRAIRQRFDSAFADPLKELADDLKIPGQSSSSPLLQSVSEIVDEAGDIPLELLIVSDMMENHYEFRFYDEVPLAEEMIDEFPLASGGEVKARIRYIQRSRHSRELEKAVLAVWEAYFEQQEIPVELDRLFVAD